MTPNAPRPARRVVVPLLALLVVAVLVVGAFVLLHGQDEAPPVLVVTGYGGDTTAVTELRDALRDVGRDAEVAPPLGDATGDIAEQARWFGSVVEETLRRTGAASVDVVGMSLGGVIVRYWATELDGVSQARRVVTMGSPHHGVDLTAILGEDCRDACRQLMPGSDLLTELNQDETPPGPDWVALWSTTDAIVRPTESAQLDGAVSFAIQSVCPDLVVAHREIPTTPAVQRMVIGELGTDSPAVPPPSVCD